jgi:hypothetical protein
MANSIRISFAFRAIGARIAPHIDLASNYTDVTDTVNVRACCSALQPRSSAATPVRTRVSVLACASKQALRHNLFAWTSQRAQQA